MSATQAKPKGSSEEMEMSSAREQILNEIQKLALANDGKPPGVRAFERETGIRQGLWRGVYWARWNDAVREAGLTPNVKQERIEDDVFLTKLAQACHHFKRFPTAMELRMYQKLDRGFPNTKSITRHFGSLTRAPDQLARWAQENGDVDLVSAAQNSACTPQPYDNVFA
jgi:hypothetical protein